MISGLTVKAAALDHNRPDIKKETNEYCSLAN